MNKYYVVRAVFEDGTRAWVANHGVGDEWFTDDVNRSGVFSRKQVADTIDEIVRWFAFIKNTLRISYPTCTFYVKQLPN